MIKLIRVDDRLIHGQCMTRIVQHFFIKEIIVVDDFTATNPILKLLFEKAVPPSIKATVLTIKDSKNKLDEAANNSIETLVLCKSPLVAQAMFIKNPSLPKEVMVGPVAKKGLSYEANFGTYLSEEEAVAVNEMVEETITVYFQILPDQRRYEWQEIKTNIMKEEKK